MLKFLLFPQRKSYLNLLRKIWIVLFIITATQVVCHASTVEDFEDPFISQSPVGQIPSGWTAIGSTEIQFSQGDEFFSGNHNLHAVMTYDPSYYAVLTKTINTGQPGRTMRLDIRAKVNTSYKASFSLGYRIDNVTTRSEHFWYSPANSEEWMTIEAEASIPESGEIELLLYFMYDGYSGRGTCGTSIKK